MNRTVLNNPRKDEIKKLGEDIHYFLKSLSYHNPGSDEFRRVLRKDMFVKENTEAFIHVTHYLFTTLDPEEFSRRFYWPIRDRSDESKYRADAVDYINFLIEKGQLKMQKIKAVHVVHPGGEKFMEMMVTLIGYVMTEVLNRYDEKVELPEGVSHEEFMRNVGEQAKHFNELEEQLKNPQIKDLLESQEKPLKEMLLSVFGTSDFTEIDDFVDGLAKHNDERFEQAVSTFKQFDSTMESLGNLIRKTEKVTENTEAPMEVNPSTISELKAQFIDELPPTDGKNEFEQLCNLTEATLPHAIRIFDQYPVPELKDIQNIGKVVSTLAEKTNNVASEVARLNRQMSTTPQISSDGFLKDPVIENMLVNSPPMKLVHNNDPASDDTGAVRLALTAKQSQLIPRTPKIQITPQINRSRARLDRSNAFSSSVMDQTLQQRSRFDSAALLGTARRTTPKKSNNTLSPSSYSMLMPGSARVLSSTVLENSRGVQPLSPIYKVPDPVVQHKLPAMKVVAEESLDKTVLFTIRSPSGDSTLAGSSVGRSMDSMDTGKEIGDDLTGFSLSNNFSRMKLNPNILDTSDNVLVDDSF